MLHDPSGPKGSLDTVAAESLDANETAIRDAVGIQPRSAAVRLAPLHSVASLLTSAVVHLVLLVLLALVVVHGPPKTSLQLVVDTQPDTNVPLDSLLIPLPDIDALTVAPQNVQPFEQELHAPGLPALAPTAGTPAPAAGVRRDAARADHLASLMRPHHLPVGGGLGGRDPDNRAQLVTLRGGTAASEQAVERGLQWLAAHQREDGSWRFNHRDSICQGLCRHPGSHASTTGATALALLPFLGAGYTSEQGPYQEVVKKGLYYLTGRMLITPKGGDLQEGTMYAHGLASIVLCEAYAMTGDPALREPAQQAVDFICAAQHPQGGWRYHPGQAGDTTVFGWQIMALKSARLANLDVPSVVIDNAMRYLDSVQEQGGATYGYQGPGKQPSPTAIGLLSRMYYGWSRDDGRLARGVGYVDALGPSKTDMYFNYYATQVMHHFQGSLWDRWNERLREHLIATQAHQGHESGSWYFPDPHGQVGGRLYTTAMCLMTLEVYYRHMPLYDDPTVETGF
jgi:hypothetical protein